MTVLSWSGNTTKTTINVYLFKGTDELSTYFFGKYFQVYLHNLLNSFPFRILFKLR